MSFMYAPPALEVVTQQAVTVATRQWRVHVRPTGKGFMQVSLNKSWATSRSRLNSPGRYPNHHERRKIMKAAQQVLCALAGIPLLMLACVLPASGQQQKESPATAFNTSGTISYGTYWRLGDTKQIYFDLAEHPGKTFAIADPSLAVKNGLATHIASGTTGELGLYSTVDCKGWKVRLSAQKRDDGTYLVTSIEVLQRPPKKPGNKPAEEVLPTSRSRLTAEWTAKLVSAEVAKVLRVEIGPVGMIPERLLGGRTVLSVTVDLTAKPSAKAIQISGEATYVTDGSGARTPVACAFYDGNYYERGVTVAEGKPLRVAFAIENISTAYRLHLSDGIPELPIELGVPPSITQAVIWK